MSEIHRELLALSEDCEAKCDEFNWESEAGVPNFHLLYTGVKAYEAGNQVAILGMNPAGGPEDANDHHRNRAFREPEYSAYLDDRWRKLGRGQSPLQRAVQGVAMVLTGSPAANAMAKIRDTSLNPEERIGKAAENLLRHAPAGNISPYRDSKMTNICSELQSHGECIGWRLLCLARPKPRLIVTLANQVSGPPWRAILRKSGQRLKSDYEEPFFTKRTYREVRLQVGPLKGALVIGLPAVVYDKVKPKVTTPMLQILSRRIREHGLFGEL